MFVTTASTETQKGTFFGVTCLSSSPRPKQYTQSRTVQQNTTHHIIELHYTNKVETHIYQITIGSDRIGVPYVPEGMHRRSTRFAFMAPPDTMYTPHAPNHCGPNQMLLSSCIRSRARTNHRPPYNTTAYNTSPISPQAVFLRGRLRDCLARAPANPGIAGQAARHTCYY